jgi:hypothetical protein
VQDVAAANKPTSKNNAGHFTPSMQTEAQCVVTLRFCHETSLLDINDIVSELRAVVLARKFMLRQGLWIEDLQTPPGQECSNGSMILLAVVLWRAFFGRAQHSVRADRSQFNE